MYRLSIHYYTLLLYCIQTSLHVANVYVATRATTFTARERGYIALPAFAAVHDAINGYVTKHVLLKVAQVT